jgi:peptide-methionine (S)-S-oxide reductase
VKNPSYKEVCNGTTGHAEVVQVIYDANVISFSDLVEVFFTVHDPTQLNRQGNDIGTQYRSAIFYHNDEQKAIATKAIDAANETHTWPVPLLTEVTAFEVFYPAEDYHDNYYNLNTDQPYCSLVITPKMEKFKKKFHDKLK